MTIAHDPARQPPGLYHLFFVEMWERFSFYGMRALLVLYMVKGFLKYDDKQAYLVYGAYGALVYATPFIGGMLADRVLGNRLAVVWGGLLMSMGHLLMTIENVTVFYYALGFLVVGNGFFKPNISTLVGKLYKDSHAARDAGFTIFYMGINLGAALAPVICGFIGEEKGWHYGFGLATIGMLIGVATFIAPRSLARLLILFTVLGTSIATIWTMRDDSLQLTITLPFLGALLLAGAVATWQLGRGGLDPTVGHAPIDSSRTGRLLCYIGAIAAVPVVAILLQRDALAGSILTLLGVCALSWILYSAFRSHKVERERLFVVVILMFFSMLFWAFFEQAGSSVNLYTDRNIDRVVGGVPVVVGQTYTNTPIDDQFVGRTINGKLWHLNEVDAAELSHSKSKSEGLTTFTATEELKNMRVGGREISTSVFQAVNPGFILLFGLVASWLWTFLSRRNLEPSTPVKFALGLIQLGLGFFAMWYGATHFDERGVSPMMWLIVGYLFQTTGELCLSPVGLSMITHLSPARMVTSIMGAWFLATAFSSYLGGAIASITGVHETADLGGVMVTPVPLETVSVYANLFYGIAIIAVAAGLVAWCLSPLLRRWMHEGVTPPQVVEAKN